MSEASENRIVRFSSDTRYRKQWFTDIHFSHPAKMHLSLQLWLIDNFTKEGETILDPMAGSGTILVACSMGRNVIAVELEQKFIRMMIHNREKIDQRGVMLGYQKGESAILWGDARNILSGKEHPYQDLWLKYPKLDYPTIKAIRRHNKLPLKGNARDLTGILVDKCIFSPPYAETSDRHAWSEEFRKKAEAKHKRTYTEASFKDENYGKAQGQIGNLPYGEIDKIITSPPYADIERRDRSQEGYEQEKWGDNSPYFRSLGQNAPSKGYGASQDNIGNLPYGSIDAVISSPPYEASITGKQIDESEKLIERKSGKEKWGKHLRLGQSQLTKYTDKVDAVISSPPFSAQKTGGKQGAGTYSGTDLSQGINRVKDDYAPMDNPTNIGNLKSDSYLSAMLQVYQQCYQVLKDSGLMVLVTKNFIRNKQQVRLDLDTIRLCKQAGFTFQDRWYRELATQSFWRTIYHQKYPDVEPIKHEDILVFRK